MKKLITLAAACLLALSTVLPAHAADGKVTYDGNAQKFIFEPGSEYSPTDLFPNFKDVMPGDTLTQKITVKNDASNKVKVKIYMRSLGAHEDSVEFLSQLGLKVQKSSENEMAYMFDAAADETAQLTDWVCLGTLYSGGEVNLDVTLSVPVELDNMFQNLIGYLDWEFMIEEFPIEPDDPQPPKTGDETNVGAWLAVMIGSGAMLIILLLRRKKEQEKEKQNAQF
jgi:LPXTG-motif cell wall-anchored protein